MARTGVAGLIILIIIAMYYLFNGTSTTEGFDEDDCKSDHDCVVCCRQGKCGECCNTNEIRSIDEKNCTKCQSGTVPGYALLGQYNAKECYNCPPGTMIKTDQTGCIPCTNGTVPNLDSTQCVTCMNGNIRNGICYDCPEGSTKNELEPGRCDCSKISRTPTYMSSTNTCVCDGNISGGTCHGGI